VSRIVASDATDARTLRALLRGSTPPGRVPISVRALNGRCVELRSGTTDSVVAVATFAGRFHLPPPALSVIGSIWDIGANVGLTTAHFAELYAGAQVVAVEPHPGNATEWSSSVRCISVECHPPYSLTSCVADLERLGFDTTTFPRTLRRRARDCVIGVRRKGGVG